MDLTNNSVNLNKLFLYGIEIMKSSIVESEVENI